MSTAIFISPWRTSINGIYAILSSMIPYIWWIQNGTGLGGQIGINYAVPVSVRTDVIIAEVISANNIFF